jgi:hypothetical protein
VVCIAATSEPAPGSESAKAAIELPAATRGSHRARICSAAASALHREREIGEAVVAGEGFAQERDRARVELDRDAPVRGAQAMLQESGLAERGDERAAARVDGGALRRVGRNGQVRPRPLLRLRRETPVLLAEKRPMQSLGVAVHQSPSKTGLRFTAKAS